jgi:hypothetical protein
MLSRRNLLRTAVCTAAATLSVGSSFSVSRRGEATPGLPLVGLEVVCSAPVARALLVVRSASILLDFEGGLTVRVVKSP